MFQGRVCRYKCIFPPPLPPPPLSPPLPPSVLVSVSSISCLFLASSRWPFVSRRRFYLSSEATSPNRPGPDAPPCLIRPRLNFTINFMSYRITSRLISHGCTLSSRRLSLISRILWCPKCPSFPPFFPSFCCPSSLPPLPYSPLVLTLHLFLPFFLPYSAAFVLLKSAVFHHNCMLFPHVYGLNYPFSPFSFVFQFMSKVL